MKSKILRKLTVVIVFCALIVGACAVISDKQTEDSETKEEIVELTWYQLGDKQKDTDMVLYVMGSSQLFYIRTADAGERIFKQSDYRIGRNACHVVSGE